MLNPEDIGRRFTTSGDVEAIYEDWWMITMSIRLLLGGVAAWLLTRMWDVVHWLATPEGGSPEEVQLAGTVLGGYGLAVLCLLYVLYYVGMPRVFVCTNGLIVRRNPVDPRERILRWVKPWTLYGYVPYKGIIGFTEDWETMHIRGMGQSIYVIGVTFQFMSQQDKMALLRRLSDEVE